MLIHNTHIALAVNRLEGNGKFGSRFRIRCLPSEMKRFISWNKAVYNHVSDQGMAWLKSKEIIVTAKSWDEANKTSILLVDWNEQNIALLSNLKLW